MHVYTAAQNLFLLAVFMFAEAVLLNQLARGCNAKSGCLHYAKTVLARVAADVTEGLVYMYACSRCIAIGR